MHPVGSGLIAAACYNTPVGTPSYNDGLPVQLTVYQSFNRYEKRIEVNVHYISSASFPGHLFCLNANQFSGNNVQIVD
jgi:hypothetical protein